MLVILDWSDRVDVTNVTGQPTRVDGTTLLPTRSGRPQSMCRNTHPMVIDFGVAKATNRKLTEKTLFTGYGQMIGTPAYMSPEQAELSRLDVDTRSDLYSLGVPLYELLTGTPPFTETELLRASWSEMQRIIAEKEPPKPSTRLSTLTSQQRTDLAQRHQESPGQMSGLLRGDLDWIVMKCLEKDRARRYETANGLARDIQRHFAHEAVTARPPSQLYEFQKALRRHKLGFIAAGAAGLAIVIGACFSAWQAVRATRAQEDAEARHIAFLFFPPLFLNAVKSDTFQARGNEVKPCDLTRRKERGKNKKGEVAVASVSIRRSPPMGVQTGSTPRAGWSRTTGSPSAHACGHKHAATPFAGSPRRDGISAQRRCDIRSVGRWDCLAKTLFDGKRLNCYMRRA